MPHLTKPYRYTSSQGNILRKTLANSKITKMLPNGHRPSRAALRDSTSYQRLDAGDLYRPSYDEQAADHHHSAYGDHGEGQYSEYGEGWPQQSQEPRHQGWGWQRYSGAGLYINEAGHDYGGPVQHYDEARQYYGGGAGGGPWTTEPGCEDRGGYDNIIHRKHDRYKWNEIQSAIAQQGQYFQPAQPVSVRGQQYWHQAAYHQDVHPAAPASQGYWQGQWAGDWPGYQQGYDQGAYYGQQTSWPPTYPSTWYRQDQMYVPNLGHFNRQPLHESYQQSYLTEGWNVANNLNANASTFQPQVARRVPPTPIEFLPGTPFQQDALFSSVAPTKEKPSHLHVLKRPIPTQEYLKNADQPAQTLQSPRQLLVVLDLNGTLLHRRMKGGTNFTARPKVNEFIHYLFTYHRVMVWSSAKPHNVKPMCEKLFDKEQYQRLVAVWARDTLRIPSSAYNSKVQVYKQLSWVWKDQAIQATNFEPAGAWDQSNTVLIDDSVDKAASEPHNIVCLEEFENRPDQKNSDVLGQVVKYLEALKYEKDVSAYMKVVPFAYNADEVFDWRI